MKYIAFLFLLSGCATSSYNQGCRDAVADLHSGSYTGWQASYCDKLEAKHDRELELQHQRAGITGER
jgi:hypothetical protein